MQLRPRQGITLERLKELLSYDPETGVFTRLQHASNFKAKAGDVANSLDKDGYVKIILDKAPHRGHRLAWLYVYGCWPEDQIDHINGIKHDNRICNLRPATASQNRRAFQKPHGNKTSKYCGVYWNKGRGRWQAQIKIMGQNRYLGLFPDEDLAARAYDNAAIRHGFFQEALNFQAPCN